MQHRRRITAADDRKVVVKADEAYGLGSRQRGGEEEEEEESRSAILVGVIERPKLECRSLVHSGCG